MPRIKRTNLTSYWTDGQPIARKPKPTVIGAGTLSVGGRLIGRIASLQISTPNRSDSPIDALYAQSDADRRARAVRGISVPADILNMDLSALEAHIASDLTARMAQNLSLAFGVSAGVLQRPLSTGFRRAEAALAQFREQYPRMLEIQMHALAEYARTDADVARRLLSTLSMDSVPSRPTDTSPAIECEPTLPRPPEVQKRNKRNYYTERAEPGRASPLIAALARRV